MLIHTDASILREQVTKSLVLLCDRCYVQKLFFKMVDIPRRCTKASPQSEIVGDLVITSQCEILRTSKDKTVEVGHREFSLEQ